MKKCCKKKSLFKKIGVVSCLTAVAAAGAFVYKKFFKK